MFQLPGGWELIVIIVILIFLFGGNKAKSAIKNIGRQAYKTKKEIDDIKNITQK